MFSCACKQDSCGFQLSELQVQGLQVHKLTQEQQNLKTKLSELETARTQAEDQVRTELCEESDRQLRSERRLIKPLWSVQAARADTALGLVQAQLLRQLQELQERAGDGPREQVELLQVRLQEEQRRSQQLEETLRIQAQQSCSQISIKQVNTHRAQLTGSNMLTGPDPLLLWSIHL